MKTADFTTLNNAGLNRQAVFALDQLPCEMLDELRQRFDPEYRYRQLILIGHAGKSLWDCVKSASEVSGIRSENPIDDFSVDAVEQWFAAQFPGNARQTIYPGNFPLGLQTLGQLAGWHHASPFKVGISEQWGTWFAYRVVLLVDADLPLTHPECSQSPCSRCVEKICVVNCPGDALTGNTLFFEKCVAYRKQASSLCEATCVARISCPVGAEHRYCDEQIRHTYSISLKAINQYY